MYTSPLAHYKEYECFSYARGMLTAISKRPKKAATEDYVAKHVTKPMALQPHEVRQVARFYWRTFAVEPYGERTRIVVR
jgi:nicotinamide mononucleotide adenylyltransferase